MLETSKDSIVMKLTIDQRNDFAELVVASGLTNRRRPLCIWIGLDPDKLNFVQNSVALDFALELIVDCEKKELDDALIRLLALVTEELSDSKGHEVKLANLHKVLEHDVLPADGIPNKPSVSVYKKQPLSINDNKVYYTDTHIVSVLQIWSPMVIVWMFLLLLVPTRYEEYIKRFRASTARNIHISLCCLLAYLPLVISALGADLKYTSISGNEANSYRIVWLAVAIAWLTTMVIGRIDSDAIGDLIGLVIGTLVSIIFVAVAPIVFDLPLGILNWVCISFTGGTAYAVAISTINDRNVQGAGIGAVVSAVLVGITLVIFTGQIFGGILVILTVVGAMAVSLGVTNGLEKNMKGHRASKRAVVTLVIFIVSLAALFNAYIR
jgi:hypothetical protein